MVDLDFGKREQKIVTLDRETAEEWLKRNFKNRPQRNAVIRRYAEAMKSGVWEYNGDNFRFDTKGHLIDGQHRLEAFLLATEEKPDLTLEVGVVTGLSPKAFDSIDQGEKRSLADVLHRRGEEHAKEMAVAVRLVWLRINSTRVARGGGLRADVAVDITKKHKGLNEALDMIIRLNEESEGTLRGLMSLGYLGALCYLMQQVDEDKARQFMTDLAYGEDLDKDSPVLKLRNLLIKNRGSHQKFTRDALLGLTIKAWNAYVAGETMNRLQLQDGEFPRIGGLDEDPAPDPEVAAESNGEAKPKKRRKKSKKEEA